jgi:hypothetical protein
LNGVVDKKKKADDFQKIQTRRFYEFFIFFLLSHFLSIYCPVVERTYIERERDLKDCGERMVVIHSSFIHGFLPFMAIVAAGHGGMMRDTRRHTHMPSSSFCPASSCSNNQKQRKKRQNFSVFVRFNPFEIFLFLSIMVSKSTCHNPSLSPSFFRSLPPPSTSPFYLPLSTHSSSPLFPIRTNHSQILNCERALLSIRHGCGHEQRLCAAPSFLHGALFSFQCLLSSLVNMRSCFAMSRTSLRRQ